MNAWKVGQMTLVEFEMKISGAKTAINPSTVTAVFVRYDNGVTRIETMGGHGYDVKGTYDEAVTALLGGGE